MKLSPLWAVVLCGVSLRRSQATPLLYAASDSRAGTVTVYDSANGSQVVRYDAGYQVGSTPNPPRHLVHVNQWIYCALGERFVCRMNHLTGSRSWMVDGAIDGAQTYIIKSLAFAGEVLFTANNDLAGTISIYRCGDGARVGRYQSNHQTGGTFHLPGQLLPVTDKLYLLYGGRFLACLQANTGQRLWMVDTALFLGGSPFGTSTMRWQDGHLILGNSLGYLESRNPQNGQLEWQRDDRVYLGSFTLNLSEIAVTRNSIYTVHSYGGGNGDITGYTFPGGSLIGRYQTTYQSGNSIGIPMLLSASDEWLHFAYGGRYLTRVRASNGQRQWLVDGTVWEGPSSNGLSELVPAQVLPVIAGSSPAKVTVGTLVSHSFQATANAPTIWSLASGALPEGVALTPAGNLTGIPRVAGNFTFEVKVQDAVWAVAARSLTLTVETPFAAWQTVSFGSASVLSGPGDDPDLDSLTNLVEYATGSSPLLPGLPPCSISPGGFTFRRSASATDTVLTVQATDDLVTWKDIARSSNGGAVTSLMEGITVSETVPGTVQVGGLDTLFSGRVLARLVATLP